MKEKKRIREELLVKEKGLSSYKRKKTCAVDNRQVSISMGTTLGIGIILAVLVLVVLADLTTLRVAILTKGPSEKKK